MRTSTLFRLAGWATAALLLTGAGLLLAACLVYWLSPRFHVPEPPPAFSHSGPTVPQLERLQYLVSARVNHDKTRQWDIESTSWIPLASLILGNKERLERQAMREAQQLTERAVAPEHIEMARRDFGSALREFYGQVGWTVQIEWK